MPWRPSALQPGDFSQAELELSLAPLALLAPSEICFGGGCLGAGGGTGTGAEITASGQVSVWDVVVVVVW